jgi:glycosyltransferase involved in cell wall biosynthesis
VVPLYNKRSTIERTVDSVLAQTFGDFELVVVDDGSSDGGAELVERRYDDPRIRVHRQANAGPGAARNRGVELARAELIAFLDADDEWRTPFLERAIERLASHPECAVFTSAFVYGAGGVNRWAELGFLQGPWRLTPGIRRDELRCCAAAFSSSSAVYRREALEAFGGFYAEDRAAFGEDIFLWIKLLLNLAIYREAEPLAHYHTEDSELGIGARRGPLPLEPMMERPELIRAVCPLQLRDTLELWLAQHAATVAFMHLDRGYPAVAAGLLDRFPRMKDVGSDYFKLRLRLASPALWNLARGLARAGSEQTVR